MRISTPYPLQILPMVWAAYNAVPPLIFFVYIFAVNPSEDRALELSCFWLRHISTLLAIGALLCLWFADTTREDWSTSTNAQVVGL
jgi:hypothetical protein